jgi:hypothetical protein
VPQTNDEEVKIIWQPTDKQAEFLSASEFEVLFGGSVGGGKTDGLLIDAMGLQHNAIEKRAYQGIIFRRNFTDLKDIIDRSHEIYEDYEPRASYDKAQHVWNFPSGARIEFGFIERDVDRFRYRGRAFQYVGWEELTLWPTDVPYVYLMSRVRSSDPSIPLYVRATTNPDGPGHKWVKKRWRILSSGLATNFKLVLIDPDTADVLVRTRRFLPARLSDNPHLGAEYKANLLLLDDDSRNALLLGRWDTPQIKGAYYTKEIEKVRADGRLTKVPHQQGVPVDTFFDLGLTENGTTAIFIRQRVAFQNRFLKSYENHGESLSHYAKWLLDQPYVYGTHYLPHDAGHDRLGKEHVKTYKQMLEELMPGHRFEIVPRVPDVEVGIQQTRDKFDNCWFDEEGCAEGFAALENYRRDWNEQLQTYHDRPLHDWSSNYADAFRQFGQVEEIIAPSGTRKKARRSSWRTA